LPLPRQDMAAFAALGAEEVRHGCTRVSSARSIKSVATAYSAMSARPSSAMPARPPLRYAPHFKKGEQHCDKKINYFDFSDPSGNPNSRESIASTNEGASVDGSFDDITPLLLSKTESVCTESKTNAGSANSKLEPSGRHRPQSAYDRSESTSASVYSREGGADWMARSVSRRESRYVTWLSSSSAFRTTSRAGSEAHHLEHEQRLESEAEAVAQYLHDGVDPQSHQHVVSQVAQWDRLSLRQWFNKIDSDKNGSISKQELLNFLRENPKFQQMLLNLTGKKVVDRLGLASLQRGLAEAREMKKVMKILKDLDVDNSGTLEFEQFLEFFRRTGHLMQYKDEANPREEMASILGDIHNNKEAVGNGMVHRLASLAKHNLTGEQSRAIEHHTLQLAQVQLTPQRVKGQRVVPLHKVTYRQRDKAC